MKLYQLTATQDLPITRAAAWAFFSDPRNLTKITPQHMGFTITSELPERVEAGTIIAYIVRPILGIPLDWVTEITHVDAGRSFTDEQRFGPYKFWHHTHRFVEIAGGIRMEDSVYYALPFGPFGRLAHGLFVKRQLDEIFAYRRNVLTERFGSR